MWMRAHERSIIGTKWTKWIYLQSLLIRCFHQQCRCRRRRHRSASLTVRSVLAQLADFTADISEKSQYVIHVLLVKLPFFSLDGHLFWNAMTFVSAQPVHSMNDIYLVIWVNNRAKERNTHTRIRYAHQGNSKNITQSMIGTLVLRLSEFYKYIYIVCVCAQKTAKPSHLVSSLSLCFFFSFLFFSSIV